MSRPGYNPNSEKWDIAGSPTKVNNFSHANHGIFLLLPFVILGLIFVFRRKLSGLSNTTKTITTASLGAFAIFGELGFDISSIVQEGGNSSGDQFVGGFDFCRMNTYIVGVFLILQRKELIKGVAATALFGGYSTLIDHYGQNTDHPTAGMHSLITHAVILTSFAALGATMGGSNYKVRNLIHSHLFNGALVAFMYFVVNNQGGGVAGELTKDRMGDNVMVGFAPGPVNMFLGILSVMVLEGLYFIIYRVIGGRTYAKKDSFAKTFAIEGTIDKVEGYGFKLGGKNSFYVRQSQRFLSCKKQTLKLIKK